MHANQINILVVEDDDFQRQMLVKMLASLGATLITEATNGRQALEIIRNSKARAVDIVLCDLNMPEMDGMEFLRHLGEENHNVSIVITSALDGRLLASVGTMTRMYGIKLLGTIEKPIMLESLNLLFARYERSETASHQNAATISFSLEEILQGIRDHQFVPFFQPKVDLQSGRIVGAEALARWIHPQYGIVAPVFFIPQLEQSANIDELTFLMLEKSAAASRQLIDQGDVLTISVNLSLVSLDDSGLADKLTRLVRHAGIDPQYIVLEITESAAISDVARVLENLARLCMNGFALSIDDYGTGYSSMQQLTRIAFSELKIDQSFVKDFTDNPALSVIVESSIDMAHKLLMKSVAEGVETQQDWDTLLRMRCDTGQGYFIAKPMNAAAFLEFVRTYNYKPAATLAPPQQDHRKIKILFVEDDDFTRQLILGVLRNLGFLQVTAVDSAKSAIELFEFNTFNLIITDINMTRMNGLKLIQMIRAGKTLAKRDARIVVLTGYSQAEIFGAALALDVNGFLVKPIIPAIMDEKLGKAMTEEFRLHSPLAYEAVKTDFNSLTDYNRPTSMNGRDKCADADKKTNGTEDKAWNCIPLQQLRPGMILKDNIYFEDGALFMSSGYSFSELSINRLRDITGFLRQNNVAVLEAQE
ncbi:MAG: EAL domain-containing protein [Burkholderiales bacterium]